MATSCSAILLLAVTAGLPFGIPPQKEDVKLSHAAPEKCLLYLSWVGSADADPASPNRTEKLLAEPEVQELVNTTFSGLRSWVDTLEVPDDEAPVEEAKEGFEVFIRALHRPSAFYVEEFIPGDVPKATAGMLTAMTKEERDRVVELFREFKKKMEAEGKTWEELTEVKVEGLTMFRIQADKEAPVFYGGPVDEYWVWAVGEESVKGIIARLAAAETPSWLANLHKTIPVERPNMVFFANVNGMREMLKDNDAFKDGDFVNFMKSTGLDTVKSVGGVSGLHEEVFVSRLFIETGAEKKGLFSIGKGKPLTAADFNSAPADALAASVFRVDGKQVLDEVLARAGEIDPVVPRMIRGNLDSVKDALEVDIEKDILEGLGDVWTVYNPQSMFSGQVMSVTIRDHARVKDAMKKLMEAGMGALGDSGPKIVSIKVAGEDVTVIIPPPGGGQEFGMVFPSIPIALCLTEKNLVFGILPAVKNHLTVMTPGAKTLATNPEIKAMLAGDSPPVGVTYLDTPALYSTAFPALQIGGLYATRGIEFLMALGSSFSEDPDAKPPELGIDISLLPSGKSVLKHLRPDVVAVVAHENGIEVQNRKVIPGSGAFVMAAIMGSVVGAEGESAVGDVADMLTGAIMPGVRNNSMSTNNLKQIGLAMHNFHDTRSHFPQAATVDDEGKSMLSWRVQILPYLEYANLYDQFHHDEPWDSEHNKALIDKMPEVYRGPGSKAKAGHTVYQVIDAKGSVFEGSEKRSFRDITDGSSNTFMAIETTDEKAVIWTKPDDLKPDGMKPISGLKIRGDGFLALFCDGSVRKLSEKLPADLFQKFIVRDDGEAIDASEYER